MTRFSLTNSENIGERREGLGNRRSIRLSYGAIGSFPSFPPNTEAEQTTQTRNGGSNMVTQGVAQTVPDLIASDSDDYETTFYGILNRQGEFWTPMPFDSIQAAKDRMAQFKGAHLERTHKIVPVRIRLTLAPIETRQGGDAKQGSVAKR